MYGEDSRNALFSEPNAFIQRYDKKEKPANVKKVVFSEPYESLPAYYINNDFKKHNCGCLNQHKCKENKNEKAKHNFFNFDLSSIMPLLTMFNKSGFDINGVTKMLANKNSSLNPMEMIAGLLNNKGGLKNLLNIFKGKNKEEHGKEIKSTDFEIKNYTKVEL